MPIIVFLNELSHSEDGQIHATSSDNLKTLTKLLRKIKAFHPGLVISSIVEIRDIALENGRSLSSLRSDPKYIDLWRAIASLQTQAPFRLELNNPETDCLFEGRRAVGLGLAFQLDTLSLSLDALTWSDSPLEAQLETLTNDDDQIEIRDETVSIRHASTEAHIKEQEGWLADLAFLAPNDGDELWETRETELPKLKFLDRTEEQIRSLKHGTIELYSVYKRLKEINESMANWEASKEEKPTFKSKTSPEHSQRRELCKFIDLDGTEKYFDYHARYTPGAGRIHFSYEQSSATSTIAHIGTKL